MDCEICGGRGCTAWKECGRKDTDDAATSTCVVHNCPNLCPRCMNGGSIPQGYRWIDGKVTWCGRIDCPEIGMNRSKKKISRLLFRLFHPGRPKIKSKKPWAGRPIMAKVNP